MSSAVPFDVALGEISSSPSGADVGAFFDFDGTLIDGYSARALYSHRLRNHDLGLGEVVHTVRAMSGGTLAEAEFMTLVTRGFTSWAGRPVEELEELGEQLFRTQIGPDQASGRAPGPAPSRTRSSRAAAPLVVSVVIGCTWNQRPGGSWC